MSTIDNRVVQMKFDNKQFEGGIKTSLNSLDALKKGLNLEGATKGLDGLNKAGRGVDLSSIANGVDNISNKFKLLSVVGITALVNIANQAVNTGKRLVKSLTVDPVMGGLKEYETKINAITTILTNTASKGTTLDQVNDALAKLNEYSDKTIYNFGEMAKNIGTFTAAGIDLDTSVQSIKGIANLAAGSGSSSMQASTAMYQLSQALAAGSVKLQDWNSVVNAGMGGELFQNALKATAKEMGVFVDEAVPFRLSLESGWISAEVLTKTLQKFAEDESLVKAATQVKTFTQLLDTMKESVESGWATSWENIIGDREQAIIVFTQISDAFNNLIGPSTDARNAMLKFWNENGGRDAIITGVVNALKGLQQIIQPISEAFREIFPAVTGARLVEISVKFKELMDKFKIGEETSDNIKRTFKGLFAVLDIGRQVLTSAGKAIGNLLESLLPAGDGFLSITANIGDFLVKLNETIRATDIFDNSFTIVSDVIKTVIEGVRGSLQALGSIFDGLSGVDMSGLDSFADRVKTRFQPLTKILDFVSKAFEGIGKVLQSSAPLFYRMAELIGKAFEKISTSIFNALDNADFNSTFDLVNGGLFAGILLGLKKFIESLTSMADDAGGFLGNITGTLDGVRGSLESYQSNIKAKTLITIATAIGILAVSLLTLSLIDSDKLSLALTAMMIMFVELFASMAVFEKIMKGQGLISMIAVSTAMVGLSVAILILSAALKTLADLDWEGITKGLVGVAGLSAILIATAKLLSTSSGKLIKSSVGFILFAVAITILAKAVERLSALDTAELAKGLIGLGLILAEVGLFVRLTGDSKKLVSTAIGLTILATAIGIFALSVEKMGKLSIEEIAKGLIALAGVLGTIVLAMKVMPKNMGAQALALVAVSAAISIMAGALEKLGLLSWEELAKGLIGFAGALAIIVGALLLMQGSVLQAAALAIVVASLYSLAKALKMLGEMTLGEIGKSLIAIAGAFVLLGAAAVVLAPFTPALLALAGTITLFGLACLAVGAGVLAFSTGLAALAVSGTAGAAALVVIISSIVSLIPFILKTLAEGLVAFAKTIGEGAPVIFEAATALNNGLATTLVEVAPVVIGAFLKILDDVLNLLETYVPKLVDSGMKIVIGFVKGVSDNIKQVVEVAIDLMLNFMSGVIGKIPDIVDAAFKVAISFINGLAEALRGNMEPLMAAMDNLMSAIIEMGLKVLLGSAPSFKETGKQIITSGFVVGIKDSIGSFVAGLNDLALEGIKTLASKIPDFVSAGANVIAGFVKGMGSKNKEVVKQANTMATTAVKTAKRNLGVESPSKVFMQIGMYAAVGFANGIRKYSSLSDAASKDAAKSAVTKLRDALSDINKVNAGSDLINPVITPVLDLTDADTRLTNLFSQSRNLSYDDVVAAKLASIANSPLNTGAKESISGSKDCCCDPHDPTVENNITMTNNFSVRNDADVRKINQDMKNLINRYANAKGVPAYGR